MSNWATRHIERFGIDTRRPHISQYAPACRNNRNGLAVALEQDVRSAARWVFQDLIWFSAWPPAIDILVEPASIAFAQIGDDEAGVLSFRARFDPGDDPLDPAPALRAVEELHETTKLAVSRRGLESRLRAGFETFDMAAQCRGWRDAEDVIEAIGATPIENLGTAIVAVGPRAKISVLGQ